MVVITVKKRAVQGKAAIKECRIYPTADFDQEVPNFSELECWVEGLLAKAGHDASSFQLLLDGTALTSANTTERLSATPRVVVNIHSAHEATGGTPPASGSAAVAPPAGGAPAEGVLTSSHHANKERRAAARNSGGVGATGQGTGQDRGNAACCCVLLRECAAMRDKLEGAAQTLTYNKGNTLIALGQWALQEWTDVNKAVSQLTECGQGDVAKELLRRARRTYDSGLAQCGLFRLNSLNVARTLKAFCSAVEARNSAAANRHILAAGELSSKLVDQCEEVRGQIEGLLQELRDEIRKCTGGLRAARSSRLSWGAIATASGLGASGSATGAHVIGLTATVTAPSSGWLGFGIATVSVWNPTGVACCGAAAVLAIASASAGLVAAWRGSAVRESSKQLESAEQLQKMIDEVDVATKVCCDMWKFMATIGQNIQSSLDHDMQHLSDSDHRTLRKDVFVAHERLEHLLDLQDECLVWMAEKAVCKLPFDVRTEVGQDRYEALKALRIAGEAAQPQWNRSG